jgi:branched-chain amino acid transport system ATP-binding protein
MSLLTLNNVEVAYDRVFLAIKGSRSKSRRARWSPCSAPTARASPPRSRPSAACSRPNAARCAAAVRFRGQDIVHLSPPERVRMGLVHVMEGRRIFEHLTPDDNLLAAYRGRAARRSYAELREQAYTYFPRLAERMRGKAGYLSGGEQQMLAIARALMTEPTLIMLDEPSLGLAPVLVKEIFAIIRKINREQKTSVLLVEQNATAALDVADHAYLIENGNIVMSGEAAVLKQNPDIQEFYLGGGERVDYHNVKHYRRRKRWLA